MKKNIIWQESSRNSIIDFFKWKQIELGRKQQKYKRVLLERPETREQVIHKENVLNNNSLLRNERKELKAKIWVAKNILHQKENVRFLKAIKCHVRCQEHLEVNINKLKLDIPNMEYEVIRVSKQVHDLSKQIVPEAQHLTSILRARKKLNILKDKLEVGMSWECAITAANEELRKDLVTLLNERMSFNREFNRLLNILNSDFKYLTDLIEYVAEKFDSCVALYDRMAQIVQQEQKEMKHRLHEMQIMMRETFAYIDKTEFYDAKNQRRALADLPNKEYERREKFCLEHRNKIELYSRVMKKLKAFTHSSSVNSIIEKFRQQESITYTYFNFANEMSYHMAFLNSNVNRLYDNIQDRMNYNESKKKGKLDTIANLKKELQDEQNNSKVVYQESKENDARFENLLLGIEEIFQQINGNPRPLRKLLGDHSHVTAVNVHRFCQIAEKRLNDLVASVYIQERRTEATPGTVYCVKDVEKYCEKPTPLNAIVMAQQCPECAEGDAYNVEDAGEGGPRVLSVIEAKKNLYEKVTQPEMQYRLHTISQCRLARSRQLTAQRNA